MRYIHLRWAPGPDDKQFGKVKFDNMGGVTIAYSILDDKDITTLNAAIAVCSLQDNFNRAEGRNRAKHRLLNEAPRWCVSIPIDPISIQPMRVPDVLEEIAPFFPEYLTPWLDDEGRALHVRAESESNLQDALSVS